VSYLSKVANFSLPHLHLGVTPSEICRDLRHQKTSDPGLSCGVVCVILCLAVSVEHWLVTDRQTYDYSIYHTSMPSCGKIVLLLVKCHKNASYMKPTKCMYISGLVGIALILQLCEVFLLLPNWCEQVFVIKAITMSGYQYVSNWLNSVQNR